MSYRSSQRRLTHDHDGGLAVFHIGMVIRRLWRVDQWSPVLAAMPPMIAELERNRAETGAAGPDWLGYLGSRFLVGGGGPTVIQWWRGVEDIYAYAGASDRAHRPAWRAFNQRARAAGGAVGIWHETYLVPAGGHESIYVNAGPLGLAKAVGFVEDDGRRTARQRLTRPVDAPADAPADATKAA